MKEVPIWEKSILSLEEASAYSGIGMRRLRNLTKRTGCPFLIWVGSHRRIKRKLLDEYLGQTRSI